MIYTAIEMIMRVCNVLLFKSIRGLRFYFISQLLPASYINYISQPSFTPQLHSNAGHKDRGEPEQCQTLFHHYHMHC